MYPRFNGRGSPRHRLGFFVENDSAYAARGAFFLRGSSGIRVRALAPEEAVGQKNGAPHCEGPRGLCCFARYLAAVNTPACSARAAALSVASQVNSGSVRPK
jgi:hypothetical protein